MLQKISLCDLHDKWLRIFHAKQVVCQIFAQHGSSKLAIDVSNHLWQSNYFREKRQCVSGGTNHDRVALILVNMLKYSGYCDKTSVFYIIYPLN